MPQCVLCEYKKSSQATLMFDCDRWFACFTLQDADVQLHLGVTPPS